MTATLRGVSVEGREGTLTAEGEREYTVVYYVQTDDKNDGAATVTGAAGVPLIGDILTVGNDIDTRAVAVDKQARQRESPTEWEVEVTFSTDLDIDPAEQIEDPTQRPAQISYSFNSRRSLIYGRFGDPNSPNQTKDFDAGVLAPNGEPFVPQPEMDLDEPVLVIDKNLKVLPNLLELNNTVNLTAFQGSDARQLRLRATATRSWDKVAGFYWQVNYRLAYRYETWDVQVQNQGTYYWNGGLPTDPASTSHDSKRKVKRSEDGRALVVNLTTAGDINTTTTPTYTRIRVYREIDFNILGLLS